VRSAVLLAAIETARTKSAQARARQAETKNVEARLASLTPRERQVLMYVAKGRLNKQTAADLEISIKTVKLHRSRAMQKMRVRTVAELVHLLDVTGLLSNPAQSAS
jgi:FixJ family two-component response regulator